MKKYKRKTVLIILQISAILFKLINVMTDKFNSMVDGCDEKEFPFIYYISCANEGGFPVNKNYNPSKLYFSF